MEKIKVLFLCVHNSARSQMAEAFLKKYAGDKFDVMSAGLEAGTLNPHVVDAMKETGIDISGNKTKSAFDLYRQNFLFAYVVTVCDRRAAEQCPIFPGVTKRLHWSFDDPSQLTGTKEEIMEKVRTIRDAIDAKVKYLIKTVNEGGNFEQEEIF